MAKKVTGSSKKTTLGSRWPLFIILAIAALILSFGLDKPFWGHHDWNGVYWGQVAKNFAVYGPFKTSFGMILNAGPVAAGEYNYNFHYFPTLTLLWALLFKIFGVANWVSRLLAVAFSLGAVTVFYKIVAKFFSQKTAVIASLFWLATPMFIYFGKMPVHEIPLMFFVLLTFWFYLNDKFRPTILSAVAAMLITWPGFFLVPILTLFKRKYLVLWPIAFVLFGLFLVHDYYVTGDFLGGGVRETFLLRTGGVDMVWFVKTLAGWAWLYYSALIPLSLIGLIFYRNKIVLMFLLYAAIYPLIFRDAASRHDYLLIYFWPFLALTSALAVKRFAFAVPIILIMLALRWNYILALEDSSLYRESVKIGQYLKTQTASGDKVLVVSYDPSIPFDGWFAGYYSDRLIDYTTDPDKINPGYKTFYYFSGGVIK